MGGFGSYLKEPVTEKISSDEFNDKLVCGASSMQGWRVNQEDAHNCILDYDSGTAFFAVYDGHGGIEVAKYCSERLPSFIKQSEDYKKGDLTNALINGFLGIDAFTEDPEVVKWLENESKANNSWVDDASDDEEEDVRNLYEEAAMPIEKVIEKYTSHIAKEDKKAAKEEAKALSGCSSSSAGSSGISASNSLKASNSSNDDVSSSSVKLDSPTNVNTEENEAKCVEQSSKEADAKTEIISDTKVSSPDSSDSVETTESPVKTPVQNGDVSANNDISSSSSSVQENGEAVSNKGKGKAIVKKADKSPTKPERPKRNTAELYKKILTLVTEEDTEDSEEDDEDKTFDCKDGASSDDDSEEQVEGENSDASSNEEEDEEEDNDEDVEEEEDVMNDKAQAGWASGCTAVVALLKGNELYVANAGDSRCIVSRGGEAIEMSVDHKPESKEEYARIKKAGGFLSAGRVNGGLNLSRAIGDHNYKRHAQLPPTEQLITALPDVKTLTINPAEDDFMVLACDGIWNSMSSQEVVDFVRPKIADGMKLSKICEELFDHCLAPDTLNDGEGCDNMTCIVVQFKPTILKRAASPEPEEADSSKRAKTEETQKPQADTTA